MLKSVVLLSGGLDSTVNLYKARQDTKVVLALTFKYGQRAQEKEEAASRYFCRLNNIQHKTLEVPFFTEFGKSSLVDRSKSMPLGSKVKLDDFIESKKTAQNVWVPNRNGIFLNIAAGYAESLGAELVIPGFNAEEGKTFPDNTEEFLNALASSFYYSTSNHVKAHSYTTHLNKTQIISLARQLAVPLEKLWPCYDNKATWCGECESCQRFKRALNANGLMKMAEF